MKENKTKNFEIQGDQKFKAIFDNFEQLVYISDPNSYEILYVNNKTNEYVPGDIIGKKCYEVFHEFNEPCSFCTNRLLFSKRPKSPFIFDFYNEKVGKWFHIIDQAIIWDDGRKVRFEMAEDITKKKNLEELLQKSEENLKNIIKNLDVGFYKGEFKGKLLIHNQQLNSILGLDPSVSLVGAKASEFLVGSKTQEQYYEELERNGYIKNFIAKIKTPNRKTITVEINAHLIRDLKGNPLEVEGTIKDITKQLELESKLKESVKELTCLYGLSKLIENNDLPIEEIFQRTLDLILPAFQFPNEICCKIIIKGGEFKNDNFVETEWKHIAEIKVKGEKIGTVEVYYLKDIQESEQRPFLREELDLINAIAEFLGRIYEQKKAENDLRDSEEKFRIITEQSLMGIAILQNNNFIYINHYFASICGYSVQEIMGWGSDEWIKIIHPEFRDFVSKQAAIKQQGTSDAIIHYESKILTKKGIVKWIDNYSKSIQFQGHYADLINIIDITDQKNAEVQLKESEEKYRKILNNIKEGYYEVDLRGDFIFFNESLCNIFEYPKEELRNMNYREYLDYSTKEKVFTQFNEVYKTEKSVKNFEYKIKTKNKKKKFIEISISLMYDSEGTKIGFFGIAKDITQRKRAELLEERFKEQLEEEVVIRTKELKRALDQQKKYLDEILRASQIKNEFLATMSHELRTPLNAIIGFTDLLLEEVYGPLNQEQLQFVNDIKSSAQHQFDMVKDILDISKIEAGETTLNTKIFSLNSIIEQVLSTFKPEYSKKNIKIKLKGLKSKKEITADPLRFKEILYNLLDNAIKFTLEGKITIIVEEDKENWIFKVKDTGIGIPEKYFDIIFKDFKRVNNPYTNSLPGTGLGLSLTKRLVNLHGGNIFFTSKLGVGTTFTFTIPKNIKIEEFSVDEFLNLI